MRLQSTLGLFGFILICLLSLPAQAKQDDKRPLILTTYEHLPRMMRYLSVDPWFLPSLAASEKTQFDHISSLIERNANAVQPISILFSANESEFVLSPGEPARSAKTTEDAKSPIYVNRLALARSDWDALDASALLMHELGHKLAEKKDQAALDSMIAKARTALGGVIKKTHLFMVPFNYEPRRTLSDWVQYWSGSIGVGEKMEPFVFLSNRGGIQSLNLRVLEKGRSLNLIEGALGDLSHVRLTSLAAESTMNGIDIEVAGELKTDDESQVDFNYEESLVYLDVEYSDTNFRLGRPNLGYAAAHPLSEVTAARIVSSTETDAVISVKAHLVERPQEVFLATYSDRKDFQLKGRILRAEGNDYELEFDFQFPKYSSASLAKFKRLVLDTTASLDLPEILAFDFDDRQTLSDLRVRTIEILTPGGWQEFVSTKVANSPPAEGELKSFVFETGPIPMRFEAESQYGIRNVRLLWKVISGPAENRRTRLIEERIDPSTLKGVRLDETVLQIEWSSQILQSVSGGRDTLIQLKDILITDGTLYTGAPIYSETLLLDRQRPVITKQ